MNQQNDYQFVMIPQKLSSCLDANCHKMLSTLIGLDSILSKEDGWFYRSNRDLQLDVRLSQNLVIATLDTLYQAGIINVDCIGKGRGHRTNRIHINFESFKVYERYSFNDIRNNPDLWIETVPYKNHYSPSYLHKGKEIGNTLGKRIGKKVTTITDTTDTSNTIDINTNTIETGKKVTTTLESLPTCIIPVEETSKEETIEEDLENMRNSFNIQPEIIKVDEKLLPICFEKCEWFMKSFKNIDYQLLIDNPQQFLTTNEAKVGMLSQQFSSSTGVFFSKNTTTQLLKNYVTQEIGVL